MKESGDFVYALANAPVHPATHSFCVVELPKVDRERPIAIPTNGILAIRMKKLSRKA